MSLLKTIKQQLGLSVTPANNFTFDASADNGTMKLARGNAGATTQDILTVAANGRVAFPQNTPVGFTGTFAGSGIATNAIIPFIVGLNDGGYFTGSRFTPLVAGYYIVTACGGFTKPSMSYAGVDIMCNGSIIARQVQGPYNTTDAIASVSSVVYMNGSTDYIEFFYIASPTGGTLTNQTWCSGSLLQRAA